MGLGVSSGKTLHGALQGVYSPHVSALITYYTWIYGFSCECVTAGWKIRLAGEGLAVTACACVCQREGLAGWVQV